MHLSAVVPLAALLLVVHRGLSRADDHASSDVPTLDSSARIRRVFRVGILSLLALLVAACPSGRCPAAEGNPLSRPGFWDEVNALVARDDIDDEAGAVVWMDERDTKVSRDPSGYNRLVRRHVQVLILDCDKSEAYANVRIPFGPGRSIRGLTARTWLKDGAVVEVSPREVHEITQFPEYVLYSKNKAKVFAFPAVCDSCLLEYEYTTFSGLYPDDLFVIQWETIPVNSSRYVLTIPTFLDETGWFAVKTNADLPDPVVSHSAHAEGPVVIRTWEMGPTPPARVEPRMPAKLDVYEYIWVGPDLGASDAGAEEGGISWWEDGGKHLWEAMEGAMRADTSLRERAALLTDGLPGDLSKAEAVYAFLQKSIRYVAIDLEASGYEPNEASEALRVRYGDCKDMVCLMLTMLREAGVTAHPAYVATRSMGQVNRNLVSTSQFNHVVVALPSGDGLIWFDPTDDRCPPGFLPSDVEGVAALVVRQDSASFVTTPVTSPEENSVDRVVGATLSEEGTGRFTLRETRLGHPAFWLRWQLATRDLTERRRLLEEIVSTGFPGARITGFDVSGLDSTLGPLGVTVDFELDAYVGRRDDHLVVPVRSSALPSSPFYESVRRYPMVFAYPYTIREKLLVEVDGCGAVLWVPPDIDMDLGFGSVKSSVFSTGPGKVVRDVSFELRETFLPRGSYDSVKLLFDTAELARESSVHLSLEP